MYTDYYNLKEIPFNQSVDPKYTWLSEKQVKALTAFKQNYLDKKGFFLITGDAGTGKTAFIKRFIAEIKSKTMVATVTDPDLDKLDFFNWLSLEFNMNVMFKSKGAFLTRFKRFLLEAHQKNINVILIIDDAHRINQELIEEILTLSTIETAGSRLMSVFFVGQSGFNKILRKKQNSVLRHSIKAHFHLKPLEENEIVQLILYRLKVAGAKAEIFSSRAYPEIYQFSAGYPRVVVNICDRAMIAGCVSASPIIDKDLIIECGKDLQIAGIKREIKGTGHLKDSPAPRALAAKAIKEKDGEIKTSLLSTLKTKIVPVARTTIVPVFLAILVIVAIYFIYQFKSVLLSWASINFDQEKSASVQSELSASNTTQKKENESESNMLLSANEVEKSIQTEEKRAELSNDGYVRDKLKNDAGIISSDIQSEPTVDESLGKPTVVDDVSDVDVNNKSLQIQSPIETTRPSVSEKKVAEIIPERMGNTIEPLPLELPEIETERESTEREFKMLSRHLALKLKLSDIERQEPDIQGVHLEPLTGKVIGALPANDSKARKDVQPRQTVAKKRYLPQKERQEAEIQIVHPKPKTEKISDPQPANDSKARIDVQPQQSAVKKPPPQAPAVKSDISKPRQEPDTTEMAGLEQVNKEDDLSNRRNLKERLLSFLEDYCHTYEAKDLDHFSGFFTADARENDKPFHTLLPKYRKNFDAIEFINYRIELQNYNYDDEKRTINIEGRFFLEWLPGGTSWRRNSGKIYLELQESGKSYKISRLDYHGDQRKKTR